MDNKIYADAFNILAGLADIKINFMSAGITFTKEGAPNVGELELAQRVILSLPLAKELSKKLSLAVEDYEKNFGAILDLDEAQKKIAQGK